MLKKPVRQERITERTQIVSAPQDAVKELWPYVNHVLTAMRDVVNLGKDPWISDASCLSDFFDGSRDRSQDQLLYDQLGKRLGIKLDRKNNDDHFIVRIALRLKRRESPPN